MLSYQINRKLIAFLNVLSSQEILKATLSDLSSSHSSLSEELSYAVSTIFSAPTSTSSVVMETAKKLQLSVNTIMKKVQTINVRQIFNEMIKIESAYNELLSSIDITDEQSMPGLGTAFSDFATNYDNYLNAIDGNEKRSNLFKFLASATSLSYTLNSLHNALAAISPYYKNTDFILEQDGRLSILLESEMDFSSFSQKICAINIIYAELCALSGEAYNNTALKIIKIESGSLWAEILGYPKIIALLESILEGSIGYMYRTFTREGKIASIPRKVETIESILELRKKLKAVGIDTTDLDENLQKASVVIAQEANNLLVGEPKLTINGRVFTIGAALEKKYLESGRQRFLPDN
jgi:hypothetical protein